MNAEEERREKEERDRARHDEQERGRAEQVPGVMGWVAGGCGDPSWNEREPRQWGKGENWNPE